MAKEQILEKAYSRMIELYGNKDAQYQNHSPSIRILNRFCYEKQFLEGNKLYLRYLELVGRMRAHAKERGEHLVVKGTAATSFIGYLLGATGINPLKLHGYCPQCKFVSFKKGQGSPFDVPHQKCNCGKDISFDGHGIFFDAKGGSLSRRDIEISVSCGFMNEAKKMICKEFSDMTIITLKDENATSPIRLCFLDKEENAAAEYPFDRSGEFSKYPHFLLVPVTYLDKFRALEIATGVRMEDAHSEDMMNVLLSFLNGDVDRIPCIDTNFVKTLIKKTSPVDYNELQKIIGFSCGTAVWNNNAEDLFLENRMTLANIPASREDIYNDIAEKLVSNGFYEDGFAYEVADKARRGYYARKGGVDKETVSGLLSLGFSVDFVFFIEKVQYMFPKHYTVTCLKYAIALMWYKIHYKKEFDMILGEGQ